MDFWVLRPPLMNGDWAFADVADDARYGDAPQCPTCGSWIGMKKWLPPYRIRLVKGMKSYEPGDIIHGPGCEPMFSEGFITAFERAGLKGVDGWEPVTIEGYNNYWEKKLKRPAPKERYKVAIFPRPTVRVKWEEMHPTPLHGMELASINCEVCGSHPRWSDFRGLVVDEESWNGTDIFRFTNIGGCFGVTEAFVKFVAEGKFRGIPLVPAAEHKPYRADPARW